MKLFAATCLSFVFLYTDCLPSSHAQDSQSADPSVKKLMQSLSDDDDIIRLKAVRNLGKIGLQAQVEVPLLTRLSRQDPDEDVRRAAQESLEKIQGGITKPLTKEEHSIVGTWKGRGKVSQSVMADVRTTLRPNGTYTTVMSMFGQVVANQGKYTYADGILTTTDNDFPISTQATITWVNRDQIIYRGLGHVITFTRE